jgi:small-conductance mechanosensitive channel
VLLDFADSALTYALRYWMSDFALHAAIASEVRTRIWYAARREGLEIPFPTRTILLPTVAPELAAAVPHEGADLPGNGAHLHAS